MRFKKNGMPYARRRKSWEIPYSERRGKGYPKGAGLFSGRSRRSSKADNEAAAALIIALISLVFWLVVGCVKLCLERYQSVSEEIQSYPHLKKKILKRELCGWGFIIYCVLFYFTEASISKSEQLGMLMITSLPIALVILFLWARSFSQVRIGEQVAESSQESESA